MPTNPYVNFWSDRNEQNLLQDLMTEAIRMYGINKIYLPRTMRREDTLYNEDVLSQYTQTFPIEMYIKNVAGWEGNGNFLNKFGLQIEHNVTMMVSVDTFHRLIPSLTRPFEGDWVYLPAPINKLFEIKFVENQKGQGQFYPLGAITFYELQLELHTYTHEEVRTKIPAINIFEQSDAYAQDLIFLSGSGTFTKGETVYQGPSVSEATGTGVVALWNANTMTLKVTDITGGFGNDSPVVGINSAASYMLTQPPDVLVTPNNPTDDNKYLDTFGGQIIDDLFAANPYK